MSTEAPLELTESNESNSAASEQKLKKLQKNPENDGYLLTFSDPNINVAVFGCDGTGNDDQKANALAVKKKVNEKKVDFVIHLGDAVYRPNGDGASKYSHLKKQLIDIHQSTNVPFFMVKGNHEENIQRDPRSKGYKAGIKNYQKVHKFFQGECQAFAKKEPPKITIGTEEKNKFNTRPKGSGAYYNIACKVVGQEISEIEYIVIDSNTLPYDEAQKSWLREKIQNSTAKQIAICCHHPILTYDKRLFARNDSKYYRNRMLAQRSLEKNNKKIGATTKKSEDYQQGVSTTNSLTENLGATIEAPPENQKTIIKNIKKEEQHYRRAYGLSHNHILKGVFRDEIIDRIEDKENNENVKKLRGFITAHNHSQGTIYSKKTYRNVFIQGAAGKEIVPPKHKDGFDVKNKMFYNNKKKAGFGIVKTSEQTLTVESHTLKKATPQTDIKSKSIFDTSENKWNHGEEATENTNPETEKFKAIKKLKALDKILRRFVLDNKAECEENKKNRKSNGQYAAVTKYARYLHNRLGNEISLTKNDRKLVELGNIAQASAEFLIKITPNRQKSGTENTNNSTNSHKAIAKKYFGENQTQTEDKVMLKNKHFYHNPSLRKTVLLISIAIVATAINFLPFGTLINLIALGGFLIFSTSPSIYFAHHYHVCRASNQYRFFSEANAIVNKQISPHQSPSSIK